MSTASRNVQTIRKLRTWSAALGVTGFGLLIVLAGFDLTAALWGWLVAVQYWLGFALGAFGILMMHRLTGGAWGEPLLPIARSVIAPLPLLAILMVPLLLSLDRIMIWTGPASSLSEVVINKQFYLNVPFFISRSIVYFIIWITMAWLLGAWSQRDRMSEAAAAGSIIVWMLTLNYFGVDWIQALEPEWYTDILGLIFATQTTIGFLALALLALCTASRLKLLPGPDTQLLSDIATMWLAGVVGWILLMFSQYIIIWSGNLPHEVAWFVHRLTPGWYLQLVLACLFFAVIPFFALLSATVRRSPRWLTLVSACALLGKSLLVDWTLTPSLHHSGWQLSWPALIAVIAIGGLLVFTMTYRKQFR